MKNENAERKHSLAGYVSIALAFLMIAVAAPAYVSAAESGNYTYTVIDNGAHVEIAKYHGPGGIVDIPSMIEGKPVTSLGSYCFSFMYGVTEVTIPDSVINITSSFYCCYDLRSVHLGDNVQNILSSAFISCPKLQSIDIPASVTSISASAFYRDVALQSINVDPANPYYVSQSGALFNKPMTSLMSFPAARTGTYEIPGTVTSVSQYAFAYSSLTDVTIGANVSSMFSPGFSSSSVNNIYVAAPNTHFASAGGVLFSKDLGTLACFPGGRTGAYVVPEFVTAIGTSAFYSNPRLTSLDTGVNTTTIGDGAMRYTISLSSISIGPKITSIADYAFTYGLSLRNITVNAGNTAFTDVNGVLFTKNLATLVAFPTARSGDYVVPNGVRVIGPGAFDYCEWITAVTLPAGVASIGEYGFGYCYNLTSINLPEGLTAIGADGFIECTSLSTLTFPHSLTNLNNQALIYCYGLASMFFEGNAPVCGVNVFYGHNSSLVAYYHQGAKGFTNPWQTVQTMEMSEPSEPSNFTAEAGRLQVQLSWRAPFDGNVSISSYTVYYGNGSMPDRIYGTYGPSTLAANVTGLAAETLYSFGVVATNAVGNSTMAVVHGVAPYDVPHPPAILGITPGYQNATISWNSGDNGGRPITGFTIYAGLSPQTLAVVGTATAAERGAVIVNLTGGSQYYFGITESSVAGESNISALMTVTPYQAPGQPRNVAATGGPMQVAVTWSAPLSDGGSPITSYKVYRQLDGGRVIIATCASGVFSFVDSNVTAGTAYSYTVDACNAGGASTSAIVTATPTAQTSDSNMTYVIVGLVIVLVAAIAIIVVLRVRKNA